MAETLDEPTTPFQRLLRNLAEAAMAVTHHDAAETEPGYVHEVQDMERRFRRLVRGYLSAHGRPPPMPDPALRPTASEQFPILGTSYTIPWALIVGHATQAVKNHDQTLSALARRGGLDWAEALAVLTDKPYQRVSDDEAKRRVENIISIWKRRNQAKPDA